MVSHDEYPQADLIAKVTLPDLARQYIAQGNIERALDPEIYGDDVSPQISEVVEQFVGRLTWFQRGLLLDGLGHSLSEGHRAQVWFYKQACPYELQGVGIELRDETVTENQNVQVDKRIQPMQVYFAYSAPYPPEASEES